MLRDLPGIEAAATANFLPGCRRNGVHIRARAPGMRARMNAKCAMCRLIFCDVTDSGAGSALCAAARPAAEAR